MSRVERRYAHPFPRLRRGPLPLPPDVAVRRLPVEGLQRFLEMVQNDEEDEWDSDELGDETDDDDFWEIPFR